MADGTTIITDYEAGQRLDKYLLKYFNMASEGFVYKMLRKKRIKLNSRRASGNEILASGDELRFYISPETMNGLMSARELKPLTGGLEIIYEDANILALNKPRGLLTHAAFANDTDTLLDRALAYLFESGAFTADKGSVFTPAFCNRLDRNTSGVVVCGKNPGALRELNRAVAERRADKRYIAVVKGEAPSERELISLHRKEANRAVLSKGGKEALTSFTRLATNGEFSLLSVNLITGRTHQIRAQLSEIGHPIAGDAKYGGRVPGVGFQLLHAEGFELCGMLGELAYLNGIRMNAPPDMWFREHAERLVGKGACLR